MQRIPTTSRRHVMACAALLALASGACADATAPVGTRPLPAGGALAKQSTTASQLLYYDFANVWIMNDDGSGAKALLQNTDQAFDPSWAPDGKRILFNAYRGEPGASIYSMDANGARITRITYTPSGHLDIRPVSFGKQVAFTRLGAAGGIYRINLDGTGEQKVSDGVEPASSPSGDRLAFTWNGDIHEYNAASGATRNLTNTSGLGEADASYSPNGKLIAFVVSGLGYVSLCTMRADGTAITRLVTSSADIFGQPKWSPDGKRIAFTRYTAFEGNIEVVNADGTGLTNLTTASGSEVLGAWAR